MSRIQIGSRNCWNHNYHVVDWIGKGNKQVIWNQKCRSFGGIKKIGFIFGIVIVWKESVYQSDLHPSRAFGQYSSVSSNITKSDSSVVAVVQVV